MKDRRLLVGLIALLVIAVGVLAWLNLRDLTVADGNGAGLVVKLKGQQQGLVSLEQLGQLEPVTFTATLRSSGMPARDFTYTGVPLLAILESVLDQEALAAAETVVARAIDGYTVSFQLDEVLAPDNVYVVYQQDGEPLGTKADGGSGPLMMVVLGDEFGQRWCKFLVEVDIP